MAKAAERDVPGRVLVALIAYYVPLVAMCLCDVRMPSPAMVALYALPLVAMAGLLLWRRARRPGRGALRPVGVGVPRPA